MSSVCLRLAQALPVGFVVENEMSIILPVKRGTFPSVRHCGLNISIFFHRPTEFEIPDADAERLMTPADIVQYVADHEDVFE